MMFRPLHEVMFWSAIKVQYMNYTFSRLMIFSFDFSSSLGKKLMKFDRSALKKVFGEIDSVLFIYLQLHCKPALARPSLGNKKKLYAFVQVVLWDLCTTFPVFTHKNISYSILFYCSLKEMIMWLCDQESFMLRLSQYVNVI